MNIKFGNFIVLTRGSNIQDYRTSKNKFSYSDTGAIIYPINSQIPVILPGNGCIGIATPESFSVNEHTTTVTFKYMAFERSNPNDRAFAKAYTSLYRSQIDVDDAEESGNSDVFIPGAMMGSMIPKEPKKSKNYFDDDDDDDNDADFDSIMKHVRGY